MSRLRGFTLIELLVVVMIIAIALVFMIPAAQRAIISGQAAVSMSNIRELAEANVTYAADHDGFYAPAQDPTNTIRWHGSRTSSGSSFDPSKGFLQGYLGDSGKVKEDPLFARYLTGADSFEDGSGGYGYNETYIGGTPQNPYTSIQVIKVPRPSQTIMFTTTAFAKGDGLQEYPFSEAPQWVDPNGNLEGDLQPSCHFRANGRAIVAWCDGHVTAELPSQLGGVDYYGGDSAKSLIGWFGPVANNGYWNPNYQGNGQ